MKISNKYVSNNYITFIIVTLSELLDIFSCKPKLLKHLLYITKCNIIFFLHYNILTYYFK